MSRKSGLEIQFTTVLYGVVVANAIYELTFGLELRNVMLLFAFVIILGDWVEYQIAVQEAANTTATYATTFVLDVTILIIWYFLTVLPVSDLNWFFAVAGIFFLFQALWDRLVMGVKPRMLLLKPELQLSAFFAILALIQSTYSHASGFLLVVAITVVIGRKLPQWRTLIRKSPDVL